MREEFLQAGCEIRVFPRVTAASPRAGGDTEGGGFRGRQAMRAADTGVYRGYRYRGVPARR
jgi:hypothetical protein